MTASWWFSPVPRGRVAALRVLVYLYVPVDVLITGSWVRAHAALGSTLYQPLLAARVLRLPTPTSTSVTILEVLLVSAAIIAIPGRAPRVTGALVAALYFAWMLIAMSFGKVDHDRYAFLVALVVLPTVGIARLRDRAPDERAGWALRCIQVSVVLTYFLSAVAKVRFGGWNWPTGATLELALIRRHTVFSTWLTDKPYLLVPMQFAMIAAEFSTILMLLIRSDRGKTAAAFGMWSFHLMVYVGVSILFLPHCVAISAFVPLERAWDRVSGRVRCDSSSTPASGTRLSPTREGGDRVLAVRDHSSHGARSGGSG